MSAPADGDGFRHIALLYHNEAEYLTGVAAFIRAALRRGEPVLAAVPGFHVGPLREVLGEYAQRVAFADMTRVGRNPGRIIPAVHAFADRHPGGRVSAVGEPAWPSRSAAEFVEVARHEALYNLAFPATPLTALCPYDATGLPAEVLETAAQTHPLLAGPGRPRISPAYLGPGEIPQRCAEPLPQAPRRARTLRYRGDLHAVRALTCSGATAAGLPANQTADLVLAVSELAASTLRHTQGPGTLRVWRNPGELVCEISDQGCIPDPLAGRRRPARLASGGHGLWLVHQVCDLVETRTGRASTTIRLHMRLPGGPVLEELPPFVRLKDPG